MVVWDVTLCRLIGTNVSVEIAASIFRVEEERSIFSATLVRVYKSLHPGKNVISLKICKLKCKAYA